MVTVAASLLGVQYTPCIGIPLSEGQSVMNRLLLIYLQCCSLVSRLGWLLEASRILKLVPLSLSIGPIECGFGLLGLAWSPIFLFAGVRFLQVLSIISTNGRFFVVVRALLTKGRHRS